MKKLELPKQKGGKPELQPMAKAIQAAMKQRGMDVPALTEALGMETNQRGSVANWVVGKNGVSALSRPKVAQVLGLDEAQLTLSVDSMGRRRATGQGVGPAQRAVALVEVARVNGELIPAPPPVSDVFTIRARSDGNILIKMDASLSFVKGAQLAQYLLGFGLVSGAEEG